MCYVERIRKRWSRSDAERLRARGLREVRKRHPEVLEQLIIRLLRIGPKVQVRTGTALGRDIRATRTPPRAASEGATAPYSHTDFETSLGSSKQTIILVSRSIESLM